MFILLLPHEATLIFHRCPNQLLQVLPAAASALPPEMDLGSSHASDKCFYEVTVKVQSFCARALTTCKNVNENHAVKKASDSVQRSHAQTPGQSHRAAENALPVLFWWTDTLSCWKCRSWSEKWPAERYTCSRPVLVICLFALQSIPPSSLSSGSQGAQRHCTWCFLPGTWLPPTSQWQDTAGEKLGHFFLLFWMEFLTVPTFTPCFYILPNSSAL